MTRPIQPNPATSTTFSCQLRRTLIAAPLDSPPPGRVPCCEKPVDWGVSMLARPRDWRPEAEEEEEEDVLPDMPLYLRGNIRGDFLNLVFSRRRRLQVFHERVKDI
jgi:hypothetical protein